jgi:uncharacterized caspase-like protein
LSSRHNQTFVQVLGGLIAVRRDEIVMTLSSVEEAQMRHPRTMVLVTRRLLLLAFSVAATLVAGQAMAERRVALVVGNSAYDSAAALRNPRNDASDMAASLKSVGFEVHLGLDLDQRRLAEMMDEFSRDLDGADVGLFFFAGHALQINDKNYLVSTSAKLENEFLIASETMELDTVVRLMESKVPTNLIFLDACRNNPLADRLRQNLAEQHRSVNLGRGLARIETAGRDTLIAFAAAPGQVANDGVGRNSPFTAALLRHITVPGLEVSVMLKEVTADVRQETRNGQRPQQLSDMSRIFYFAGASPPASVKTAEAMPGPAVKPAEAGSSSADTSLEVAFWTSVQAANDCESVRTYLQRFPNGAFVELAKLTEQRLCGPRRRVSIETTQNPTPSDTVASATVLAPAEKPPAPPPANPASEPAKTDSAPAAHLAMVPPPQATPPVDDRDVVRKIQAGLSRLGCTTGDADGSWRAGTKEAVQKFNRYAHTDFRVDGPSPGLIAAVGNREDRVCPLHCGRGFHAEGGDCVATRSVKRQERERPAAAERSVPKQKPVQAAARRQESETKSGFSSPLCQTRIQVMGGKWCCTYDPPSGAPRIICP